MAEIVVLNRWRSENATRRDQISSRPQIRIGEAKVSGQLLLFTGVRYERYGDFMDRKAEPQAVYAD